MSRLPKIPYYCPVASKLFTLYFLCLNTSKAFGTKVSTGGRLKQYYKLFSWNNLCRLLIDQVVVPCQRYLWSWSSEPTKLGIWRWDQNNICFIFCREIKGSYSRKVAMPKLWHIKLLEILHVLFQRDQDGRSIQCSDHDQNSGVNLGRVMFHNVHVLHLSRAPHHVEDPVPWKDDEADSNEGYARVQVLEAVHISLLQDMDRSGDGKKEDDSLKIPKKTYFLDRTYNA